MARRQQIHESEAARLRKLRSKRKQEGRSYMTVDLPDSLIQAIDQTKLKCQLSRRALVVEHALRTYLQQEA